MDGIRTTGELASALGEAAREIAADHGDAAAQTLSYALFLRRIEPGPRVAGLIDAFPDPAGVSRIESILDSADLGAVFACYANDGRNPGVYFHEEFLRAYDPANSRKRGVHYSPPAVVSYIVRGVESILESRFRLPISDATVLDPCCGIGTFLRHIEVRGPRPRRMLGMELAPATCELAKCLLDGCEIAQADALGQSAGVSGSPLRSDPETPAPLVVIGNPPYSGHSANAGKIGDLMADYRAGLEERNPKWLQDDYVKFIRIAQHWVDQTGRGIVAFITNHSFIFNPTFRAMRESLMRSFDELYLLDLHGNTRLIERTADADPDENVFPIRMGTAISFMVKLGAPHQPVILSAAKNPAPRTVILSAAKNLGPGILRDAQNDIGDGGCRVWHAGLRGTREEKLRALSEMGFDRTPWVELRPVRPFLLFTRHDGVLQEEYAGFHSLFDVFGQTSVGFVTSRDAFAVDSDRDALLERIAALRDGLIPPDEIRARYSVGDLDIESARLALQQDLFWEDRAVEVLYRPFDRRWAYLSRAVMERPRLPFMENLLRENLALAVGRAGHATGSREWDVVFCTDCPADLNLFRRGGAMLFPMYVYERGERRSNIMLDVEDPDMLFRYIYALLHSATYRERYRELLMVDFPRIPIARDRETFQALAELGEELIRLHLMRAVSGIGNLELGIAPAPGRGDTCLRIGGYELPRKYLQDRKGRDLTPPEAQQVQHIKEVVARTTEIRARIDQVVRANPPWVNTP